EHVEELGVRLADLSAEELHHADHVAFDGDGEAERGVQSNPGGPGRARKIRIVYDVGNEGGPPARPDAAGQADAALEHRRAAQRFEIVDPGAWRPPDLDAAEAVGVSIDLPQRAVLPAERR